MSLRLHLIESDEQAREILARDCSEAGWTAESFDDLDEFLTTGPSEETPLLIFSVPQDWNSADRDSDISRFKSWHEEHSQIQLILLLPEGFSAGDRLALKLGARHILYRPYRRRDMAKVLAMIAQGIGKRKRMSALKKRSKTPQGFEEIIGVSDEIRDVIDLAETVAKSDSTSVMITGECGTGKGAIAKAIHLSSTRCDGPFIEVNCAAIPRNLLESEFFGYEKGAFTDAKEEKIGLFECANGGTIFLDEVGEIDYSLQAKLLKFLDSRVIRRVSGTQFLPVDVRVISATNRDLKQDVAQKRFRSDLYYRLNVVEIHIPSLRKRPEDIIPIAESYINRHAARHKKGDIALSEEAILALKRYSWPGNIRELINIIERAVLLNSSGVIEPKDLPLDKEEKETTVNINDDQGIITVDLPSGGVSLHEVEKGMIVAAITKAEGNIAGAARLLKIGRGTLRYKMKKYGIDNKEIKKNIKIGKFEPICATN